MHTHQITKSWKRLPRDFRDMYWNQSDDLSDQKVYKHGSLVYSGKEISSKLQRKYTFNNLWQRTDSGLRKSDLTRSRTGKIVSKAKSDHGKSNNWILACAAARESLKLKGFHAIKKDNAIYRKAKAFHNLFKTKPAIKNKYLAHRCNPI